MASERLFEGIPPFPNDIPTASMSVISLRSLRTGDIGASAELVSSAQKLGFFLLDLHGDEIGSAMIDMIDALLSLNKEIMDLPDHVKQQYLHNAPKSFLGFKPQGDSKIETMEPDRFEWFIIGQDGLTGTAPLQPLPPVAHENMSLLLSFQRASQEIIDLICKNLALQLGLHPDAFTSLQSPAKPSGTVIRLIKAYACPQDEDLRTSMVHHTDFGTITLLANVVGGLQILAPGKSPRDSDPGTWLWVRPRPGCLIVNLGDAMVQWTGGALRSNVHRIRYPPGQQRFLDRYSCAILARPERNASMKRLIGQGEEGDDVDLTAWEWEVRKSHALQKGDETVESKGGYSG